MPNIGGLRATRVLAATTLLWVVATQALAESQRPNNGTNAGELIVEPSTLISLGYEWTIEGDDNRNAGVVVSYREKGAGEWRTGLPPLRLQHEAIKNPPFGVVAPNMFAGSVFDLEPNTEYQIKLQLKDPDGVRGKIERIFVARTRAEPQPSANGRTFHVYPPEFTGAKQEPSFTGLLAAYYTGSAHADWSNAFPPRVRPGDVILVHAGIYKDNRHRYGGGMGTVFDGTYYLTAKGTAERPIVIKAAGDGEVVFDGDGNYNLFNVMAADYNYFEGLTIRNTEVAFLAGQKNIAGAVGFTLKWSKLEDIGAGVMSDWSGSKNFYIADNTFVGRQQPDRLIGWTGRRWTSEKVLGFPQPLKSYFAVKLYGSGHVVAFNSVANFHDGIDHATYGNPDNYPKTPRDRMPVSIDIYNNDIFNVDDNCIEADGAFHNVRVLRNRCFNHGHRALSTQPVFGGPVYFIRNLVYNAPEGGSIKLHANPSGVVFYHNTLVGEVHEMGKASNVHFRNNLILGQGAFPEVFSMDTLTHYSSSDYNGFAPNRGASAAFGWNAPTAMQSKEPLPVRRFASLSEYAAATGQDTHSILIDYDSFNNASRPTKSIDTLYKPSDYDFRLRASSPGVDAGVVLPNVNDNFNGKAPDLGAYERGATTTHYGPRIEQDCDCKAKH